MSKVSGILSQVALLDDKEMVELSSGLRAMKAIFKESSTSQETAGKAGEIYYCIGRAVYKARGIKLMPLKLFLSGKGWGNFAQAVAFADEYLTSLEKDRVKQLAVRQRCITLMVHYLIEQKLPLTRNSFTYGLANLPVIMDRQFPGYAKSGTMHFVLEAMFRGTKKALKLPG